MDRKTCQILVTYLKLKRNKVGTQKSKLSIRMIPVSCLKQQQSSETECVYLYKTSYCMMDSEQWTVCTVPPTISFMPDLRFVQISYHRLTFSYYNTT